VLISVYTGTPASGQEAGYTYQRAAGKHITQGGRVGIYPREEGGSLPLRIPSILPKNGPREASLLANSETGKGEKEALLDYWPTVKRVKGGLRSPLRCAKRLPAHPEVYPTLPHLRYTPPYHTLRYTLPHPEVYPPWYT